MDEKRRYHRMKIEIPMNYRIPPEDNFNITTTLDISGTGIAFTSNTELKIGWEVFMHLLLSEEQEIELRAEVVWVKKPSRSMMKKSRPSLESAFGFLSRSSLMKSSSSNSIRST